MSQASHPRTPGELFAVLQEFTAGQETGTGLDADPAECRADLVTLAKSLSVLTSTLARAVVRYDRLEAGSRAGKPHQRPATRQTGEDPAAGTPGEGFAWRKTSPANLMIIASHDLLTGKPGAEPATLGDGTLIPAETARRYACEAALNRIILADGDQPLRLGRTRRLFTPGQVKAMTIRDRTCRWKGCEVPAIRCSPHHWVPWSQGGATDDTNGIMLCATHHRMTHEDQPATGPHIIDPPEPGLHAA